MTESYIHPQIYFEHLVRNECGDEIKIRALSIAEMVCTYKVAFNHLRFFKKCGMPNH